MTWKTIFILLNLISVVCRVNCYKLKQVVVLSRHNIRAPLTSGLEEFSPNAWPKWNISIGHLTPKGTKLEGYIADYFIEWLKKEGLFSGKCPDEDFVTIYANSRQRTIETAKAFAKSAFKNCNVNVQYKITEAMDPVFNFIIRNGTQEFKDTVLKKMHRYLSQVKLKEAFKELEKVLNFKNSRHCKVNKFCDLTDESNRIVFKLGEQPDVFGSLSIGNSVVDPFIMSYYEGIPIKDIAWGKMNNTKQWDLFSNITTQYHNARFNCSLLSKDLAQPLLKYMSDVFINGKTKLTVLFGHDSNIFTILSALKFKHYDLADQIEKTPIGGKLVFQKWINENDDSEWLKVDYLYQSKDQLRNADKLTFDKPPQWYNMAIEDCVRDKLGFCPWQQFLEVLKSTLN